MRTRDASNVLTAEQANAIFDVLVAHAGVREDPDDRFEFVFHQTSRYHSEYRLFGANLGFGAKFWRNVGSRQDNTWGETWYIAAYSEDVDGNPERQARIAATNAALAELITRFPDHR